MGLDLWFREDVARILASKARPATRLPEGAYQNGYLDALADVGVAFGVVEPEKAREVPVDGRICKWACEGDSHPGELLDVPGESSAGRRAGDLLSGV
jgi:hypothetical protein